MGDEQSEKVSVFLGDLKEMDAEMYGIVLELRKLVFDTYSGATEKVMYGGIVFTNDKELFGGVFPYKNHVSMEFSKGYLMEDCDGRLEGKGKYRRHLKFKNMADILWNNTEYYIRQAI